MSTSNSIGCCHLYNECSDVCGCLNTGYMSRCMYWNINLSKGKVIFGQNPGIRAVHLYIIVDKRAFLISKTDKGYSYSMDLDEIKILVQTMDLLKINYSLTNEGYERFIEGTPEEPAQCRLEFYIDNFHYNIRNYNGYELQEKTVSEIQHNLDGKLDVQIINLSSFKQGNIGISSGKKSGHNDSYYGRETVMVFNSQIFDNTTEQNSNTAMPDSKKPENERANSWDLEQMSMFGTILDKNTGKKYKAF